MSMKLLSLSLEESLGTSVSPDESDHIVFNSVDSQRELASHP